MACLWEQRNGKSVLVVVLMAQMEDMDGFADAHRNFGRTGYFALYQSFFTVCLHQDHLVNSSQFFMASFHQSFEVIYF